MIDRHLEAIMNKEAAKADDLVERATSELLAHGEFSSRSSNNRANAQIAAETIINMASESLRAQLTAAEVSCDELRRQRDDADGRIAGWKKRAEAAEVEVRKCHQSITWLNDAAQAAEAQLETAKKALEEAHKTFIRWEIIGGAEQVRLALRSISPEGGSK